MSELRIANDKCAYSWPQFREYYGDTAERRWNQAQPLLASPMQQPSGGSQSYAASCPQWRVIAECHCGKGAIAEPTTVSDNAAKPNQCVSAAQTFAGASSSAPGTVTDPEVLTVSAAKPASVESDPRPILFTQADLAKTVVKPGTGGVTACQKQRSLRQFCFANEVYEVDLSDEDYDWRGLIRCMPADQARALVGDGIVGVKFRLLQNVVDHNYLKKDSGEKTCVRVHEPVRERNTIPLS